MPEIVPQEVMDAQAWFCFAFAFSVRFGIAWAEVYMGNRSARRNLRMRRRVDYLQNQIKKGPLTEDQREEIAHMEWVTGIRN